MEENERKRRGLALLYQLQGQERAENLLQTLKEVSPEFEKYIVEFAMGEIWSRPVLDIRTRSLITISGLCRQPRSLAFEVAIRSALNSGATKQEVIETLIHLSVYAGFPNCWECLVVVNKILQELNEEKKAE